MEERLQKIMAQAGLGSRRSCEELIGAGRVQVNGKTAILGQKADPEIDHILVDGQAIKSRQSLVYVAVYKPRGVLSDVDPEENRPTVRGLVPVQGHLFSVGRLDFDSEGLILLTNDGEMANKLTHPRYGHEKEYRVWLNRQIDEDQLEALRRGIVLEDGYRTRPANVIIENTEGKGAVLRMVLREGRKRQIREMCTRIGLAVTRLVRVRIGTLLLGALKASEWRYLTRAEVQALQRSTVMGTAASGRRPAGRPPVIKRKP